MKMGMRLDHGVVSCATIAFAAAVVAGCALHLPGRASAASAPPEAGSAALSPACMAAGDVMLVEEPMVFRYQVPIVEETNGLGRSLWRDQALASTPLVKGDNRARSCVEVERTETALRLENRFVRVTALPGYGGLIQSAQTRPDNEEFFTNHGYLRRTWPYSEQGIKMSFPFAEHGMILADQPCAWRAGAPEPGRGTVSMWQEFSRFNESAPAHHVDAKGGKRLLPASHSSPSHMFSDMTVSQIVTVEKDHAAFTVTYRMANPTPWRLGRRCWNTTFLPRMHTADGVVRWPSEPTGPGDAELVLPTADVSHHFAQRFRPAPESLTIDGLPPDDQTFFALEAVFGFAGIWYPRPRINRLRLNSVDEAPGMKSWFSPYSVDWRRDHPQQGIYYSVELWGGTDNIFEGVEHWLDPGEDFRFSHTFLLVRGIGKAHWADRELVLHVAEPEQGSPELQALCLRPRNALSATLDGKSCGEPIVCGPTTPARFALPARAGRLRIEAGGVTLFDRMLPLAPESRTNKYDSIRQAHQVTAENCEKANAKKGYAQPDYRFALDPKKGHPDPSVARGRVLLRDGQVAAAEKCLRAALEKTPDDGEGWHLLGAALLEEGRRDDAAAAFEKALSAREAYPAAGYLLAVTLLAKGESTAARGALSKVIEARPHHVQARLLHTWLLSEKDPKAALREAERMEAGDPADPRHVAVLAQARRAAGQPAEAMAARKDLDVLCENAGAKLRIEEFMAVTRGEYRPPLRRGYPEEKKTP